MNKPLLFNLLLTLLVWFVWYSYTSPGTLLLIKENWPVTVTMVIGSFIAGATSEGGGGYCFSRVYQSVANFTAGCQGFFSGDSKCRYDGGNTHYYCDAYYSRVAYCFMGKSGRLLWGFCRVGFNGCTNAG